MTPDEFAKMISEQPGSATSLEPGLPIRGEGLPQLGPPSPSPGASGPDNKPGLNDSDIVAEFVKPDGSVAWLQADNSSVYTAKRFVATGRTMSWTAWNVYAANIERWKAIGDDQSATYPPLFPGPVAGG